VRNTLHIVFVEDLSQRRLVCYQRYTCVENTPSSELMAILTGPANEFVPAIEHIDFVVVRLPFVHPFGTSVHVWTVKEALLLRVESGGIEAWGECVADPDPFYLPETTGTARHIIKDFLLPLIDARITLGQLEQRFRHIRGHNLAKATIENALLTLIALQKKIPLHQLLGWQRKPIMSGISIGLRDTVDELLEAVDAAVAAKYHRVKMKITRGRDVSWVRAVREKFPDLRLMVDANGDYTLDDIALLKELDAFDLMMIEQPLSYNDIYQHSILQKQLSTRICLDESILNLADASTAIALGACGIINIKQGRVGGLMESLRIAAYASTHGVDVWSGGMDETGIGRAVNMHLQTASGFTLPGDTSETRNYFAEDIIDKPVTLESDGSIILPEGAGLGVTVVPERLERYTIQREHLW
jgi:o-succinylbenzoate synthase